MSTTIRGLTPDDVDAYVALRIEMLNDSPRSFGASLATDVACDAGGMRKRLEAPEPNRVWGAFSDETGELVAVVGGGKEGPHDKRAHVYAVWGMYVTPSARGCGLGRALMERLIAYGRGLEGVISIYLSVSATAPAAEHLYTSLGFEVWGREPRSLQFQGEYYDEIYMLLELN
ncbi:MAG: GNAT superfamily N-acetyltransferase [Bacteroidia bacterium]|jgi:GNAT superfamily N-acetyltransferase